MRPLLSPAQMGEADKAAIESGTPVELLMDRAGRALARAAIELAGGRYGRRVAAVCGKGNNGGDGFAAARVLAQEGCSVVCLLVVDRDDIRGAATEHLDRALRAGVRVQPFDEGSLDGCDVVIDAIFGTGFKGRPEGPSAKAIEAINRSDASVIAVDIPSGVDGTTGAVDGLAVDAHVTVAMACEKWGTALAPGAAHAGRVTVADIGIVVGESDVWLTEATDVRRMLPRRAHSAHKRSSGSVVIVGGSTGMSGAVILCALGAIRTGAGYATVGTTAGVQRAVAASVPEVLTRVLSDEKVLDGSALESFEDVLAKSDAIALGPGLGQGSEQRELVDDLLSIAESPLVVDADGLNILSKNVKAVVRRQHATVLTPHPAELGRLLNLTVAEIQADRLDAARRAAKQFGAVVVLKGHRSVIAAPDGRVAVDPAGGPELATAGTGDVLTGVVAALLAAGLETFEAAWVATYLHGTAGRIAARQRGISGVLASDVAAALPPARRSLEAG